jgi:hypothetical protein
MFIHDIVLPGFDDCLTSRNCSQRNEAKKISQVELVATWPSILANVKTELFHQANAQIVVEEIPEVESILEWL